MSEATRSLPAIEHDDPEARVRLLPLVYRQQQVAGSGIVELHNSALSRRCVLLEVPNQEMGA